MCILHRSYTYRLHNATSLEELYLDVATIRVSVRSSNIHNKASCRYSYMLYQSFQCVQFCCVPLEDVIWRLLMEKIILSLLIMELLLNNFEENDCVSR